MRRLILAGLALLAVPALALGGKTVTAGTDTLRIKAKLAPAKASKTKGAARPVAVKYDYVAGTTDGSRLPDLRSVKVFLGGVVTNYDAFPKCDETDARTKGRGACPEGSRVGSGRATAEIHLGDSKEVVSAKVLVYNGRLDTDRNGAPLDTPKDGLLIYTKIEGANLALPFWAERGNRQVAYYNPEQDPDPNADALYTIKEVHLTFPRRSARKGGRRIPWNQAPRKCRGRWTARTTSDRYQGGELTAKHVIKCEKA